MKKAAGLHLIIFFLFPFIIFAQVTEIEMLGFNPNPQSYGLGLSGVSAPSNDPLAFYSNPAILGYSSQTNNLSYQYYPSKVNWFGSSTYTFNSKGFTAGYNFGKIFNRLNLSAGVGVISSRDDYELNYPLPGAGGPSAYDKYNAFGIGVSLDYFINLSIGLTIKNIDSHLPPIIFGNMGNGEAKVNALDWGILLNVPISKLAFNDYSYKPLKDAALKPIVNFSIGYSRSNIGDEANYDNQAGGELPLTARLGYSLSPGIDILIKNHSINFITYDITAEAEDILVSRDNLGHPIYQGLLGDIKFWDNLIDLKRTNNVTLRKAQKLSLFETLSFLYGTYYIPNDYEYSDRTYGFILSTNGLFKLLSWNFSDNPYIKFFLDHFEINYVNATLISKYSILTGFNFQNQTDIKAISVSFNRFTF
jgi:hypothetical protein